MRILVCVKQVPDAAEVRLNEDFTIQREGAAHRMNPADESALELTLFSAAGARRMAKRGRWVPCWPRCSISRA